MYMRHDPRGGSGQSEGVCVVLWLINIIGCGSLLCCVVLVVVFQPLLQRLLQSTFTAYFHSLLSQTTTAYYSLLPRPTTTRINPLLTSSFHINPLLTSSFHTFIPHRCVTPRRRIKTVACGGTKHPPTFCRLGHPSSPLIT